MAILTNQKSSSLFDRKEGDEEEAQIVVNPFMKDFYLLTGWTWPCLIIQYLGPWLNSSDEEKHHLIMGIIMGTQYLIILGNLSHINYGDTIPNYSGQFITQQILSRSSSLHHDTLILI